MKIFKLHVSKMGIGWEIDSDVLYRKWPWKCTRGIKYHSDLIPKEFKTVQAYKEYRVKFRQVIAKIAEKARSNVSRHN